MEPGPNELQVHANLLPARVLLRAGEAPRIYGNEVRLLSDGPEVFASWHEAIAQAQSEILFENYIVNSDRTGRALADALIDRARAGVRVCFLYDWFGSVGSSRSLFVEMQRAGIEVRSFNPARLTDPVGAFQRDHRKTLCVDRQIAFVGGLCVGDAWAGDPKEGIPPWRDTAVRIKGPAALALCHGFNETWSLCGSPLVDLPAIAPDELLAERGGAPVQIISGLPGRSRVYRLSQVLLSTALCRIWITDAYFLTPPTIYEALVSAARDGVDVRILVPGRSDIPWINWAGRAGYAGLLAAGVRLFEWEGPMLHAKTSVIDSHFCRVGSSNLNLASLLTNWEMDVAIEDAAFAATMEQVFLSDLSRSRELILRKRFRRFAGRIQRLSAPTEPPEGNHTRKVRGNGRRIGSAVLRAALRRPFQHSAISVSAFTSLVLLGVGTLALFRPTEFGLTVGGVMLWLGFAAMLRVVGSWLPRRGQGDNHPRLKPGMMGRVRRYLQQAKAKDLSQLSPPPNQSDP